MIDFRKKLGKEGEEIALNYLKEKGIEILEKNWQCKIGEIDLIGKSNSKEDTLIFFEVKTKRNVEKGSPEEMVNYRKKEKLKKLAYFYLKDKGIKNINLRIDVIAIYLNSDGSWQINHIENAVSE